MKRAFARGGVFELGIPMKLIRSVGSLLFLFGCALPGSMQITQRPEQALSGARELAVIGRRGEVARRLEDVLRDRGFRVKRFVSVAQMTEKAPDGRVASYDAAATRYELEVDADVMVRCFGGGFRTNSIRVDLIDLRNNEAVMSLRGSGYTEDCQPMSGTIFRDVAEALVAAWEKEPAGH